MSLLIRVWSYLRGVQTIYVDEKLRLTGLPSLDAIPFLSDKDPDDWTLTASSTQWLTETFCPRCKKPTCHEEKMAKICNGCGYEMGHGEAWRLRTYRKIILNGKWVYQYKCSNDEYTIRKGRTWQ